MKIYESKLSDVVHRKMGLFGCYPTVSRARWGTIAEVAFNSTFIGNKSLEEKISW